MSGGGADLNYTDDELDSYETIWDGESTDTTKADHKRVVTALKNISEGNALEDYMDVDNLLRYMAVHIFSVNEDSLSGSMAHNYYLYEAGGKLNLIPWDYNLALGGMGRSNDATSVVNDAIDNAFSGTTFFDTLMENETYHSQYYAYLQQLVSEYINGGGFDAFYERVRSQIDTLVETDPTAFYSYDEYLTAVDTLYQVVKLRGESIQGQLDGTIPSTEAAQRTSDALVDASALDLSAMGYMNSGGGGGFDAPAASETRTAPDMSTGLNMRRPQALTRPSSAGKGRMLTTRSRQLKMHRLPAMPLPAAGRIRAASPAAPQTRPQRSPQTTCSCTPFPSCPSPPPSSSPSCTAEGRESNNAPSRKTPDGTRLAFSIT